MSAGYTLFERWKAHRKFETSAEAAAYLKVSEGSPSNWKHGRSNPTHATVETMASELGELAAYHLLMIAADKEAHSLPNQRALLKAAARIANIAACVTAALALWTNVNCAECHNYNSTKFNITRDVLYIHADLSGEDE